MEKKLHGSHVEAGPNRTEMMGREVMEACLSVCREQKVKIVDITGGHRKQILNLSGLWKKFAKHVAKLNSLGNGQESFSSMGSYSMNIWKCQNRLGWGRGKFVRNEQVNNRLCLIEKSKSE